ncbi:MAG: hypothetical protein DWQ06_13665 [Calditrichaeota bacterium]|nr:MAG: hypothetical protein DWQ06_13665 [Calditrichota bacterium]
MINKDFLNFKSSYKLNFNYNDGIRSLMEDYFSPDTIGPEGYIQIGVYRKEEAKKYTTKSKYQFNLDSIIGDQEIFSPNFSAYENMVSSHLFNGNYNSYVISGPMGSGKSTTLKFIFNELKKQIVLIHLDFDEDYTATEPELISNYFLEDLYEKLKVGLIEGLRVLNNCDEFLAHVIENSASYTKWFSFSFSYLEIEHERWDTFNEDRKIVELFIFMENKTKTLKHRVDMVMKFLNFVDDKLNKCGKKLIVFYDNIDKLPPISQISITNRIIAFNKIAKVISVISIRRSTKAKYDKGTQRILYSPIGNRAQTAYGHIYHHGPSPLKVLSKRINYLIDNFGQVDILRTLSDFEKKCILERAKEFSFHIRKSISNPNEKSFINSIYCTSARSIRLSLTLAPRAFCNSVFPFNKRAKNANELARSLYIGIQEKSLMQNNDAYVANIFSNKNLNFDIINYLIFTLLEQKNISGQEYGKKVGYLYTVLEQYFGYSNSEIVDAFNYLLTDRRPLIGGEYIPFYLDSDDLCKIDDDLRIIELGYRYFVDLVDKGTIYTQTCLSSLKWSFGSPSSYEDTILNRAYLIRNMLSEAKEHEEEKFSTYFYNIEPIKSQVIYKFESVVKKLFISQFNVFCGILASFEEKQGGQGDFLFNLRNELENWIEEGRSWENVQWDKKTDHLDFDGLVEIMEKSLSGKKGKR